MFLINWFKGNNKEDCIFCKIISGEAPCTKYYEDEECLVFKDIKPASTHHLLAIPKMHIKNIDSLTKKDIPLVQKMVECSKKALKDLQGDMEKVLLGFHCPPFNSVPHLHLHIISPIDQMSYLNKLVYKPELQWFCTAEDVIAKLENS